MKMRSAKTFMRTVDQASPNYGKVKKKK